jgi:ribosomal protein S18 acetylase RimI-like enzyme
MKLVVRRSTNDDLDLIYNLHKLCFDPSDQWYKSIIMQYLNSGIIIENKSKIIGVILQGSITPTVSTDIFEYVNDNGELFFNDNMHLKELYGIVMICIHPKYRNKGLAQKLIQKHFDDNNDKLVCLNTRRSNINAYQLYKKMGYEHIAYIKNKYFLPDEDSIFMIKNIK